MKAPRRPQLTRASKPLTFEVEAINERGEAVPTPIAGEHPLTLYVDKREIVTLMTLGQAPEALALGYLRNQRLANSIADIAAVQVDWETASVEVTTRKPLKGLADKMKKRTVTTGCGQGTVFGDLMEEIDSIKLRDDVTLTEEALHALLDAVRRHEAIYKEAGAVHGCALATNDAAGVKVLYFIEDVGRHNAVDKLVGHLAATSWPLRDLGLLVSGRVSFEIVQKAAVAGLSLVCGVSAASTLAVELAEELEMTVIGFLRPTGFTLYTGAHRVRGLEPLT